ncbi:MAG: hypothetical protein WCL50_15915 [Spirochaetota bacterium]
MRKILLALALVFALDTTAGGAFGEGEPASVEAGSVPPSTSPWTVTSSIDWQRRVLVIHIALDLRKAGLRLPEGRLTAERIVSRDLPSLVKDPFFSIPVDSRREVGDTVIDGTVDISAILDLARLLVHREDSLSKDLSSYLSTWELPLGSATALYLRNPSSSKVTTLPSPLSWKATRAFSGIIIYADAELPVRGERGVADRLRASLFPRIYDADMNLLVDRTTVRPSVLVAWGPLAYSATYGTEEEARVGTDPLRIRASELFGTKRTDLVLSREDADRILALDANKSLVYEGRILVIVPRNGFGKDHPIPGSRE